ncbi:MAG: EscU/YscU/HrcU family type III secretion system export apparatus switch protein [Verrucomicrobiota bacterium]|jgi:flagellar biosynthesis protein FlhB
MSEQTGEKTEQATPRRLEEAIKRGQFPRSVEVQTVFVLLGGLMALSFTGHEIWRQFVSAMTSVLGHLHDLPITLDTMQGYLASGVLVLGNCVWPVALAGAIGGLLAGGIQSRFQTASEALAANWQRLNPVEGLKRVFSMRSGVPAIMGLFKLAAITLLSYSEVKKVVSDPIFYTSVSAARISEFLAESALKICLRVVTVLILIAVIDYAYQFWRTNRDLMMTKEEVKDEAKNSEGNPQIKAQQRKKRQLITKRKMLAEVPNADVVVTNPTHLAVALRYDRKTMKAPRIVAKGSRLNALRIREIARQHQVPIVENKPLARLMFRYGRVGGEIPAQLYAAVAELLAWVYRVNRTRYYMEQNQVSP